MIKVDLPPSSWKFCPVIHDDFLDTKISNASLLIKTISERNLMYEKTIKLLCEIQTKFLKHGNKYLKPLKLSDIY